MMIRGSSVRDRLYDTYLVYIPNLDVYRENGRTIALATMNNEEYFAFPTTGLLDVELTVQLRWNSGEVDANFCRGKNGWSLHADPCNKFNIPSSSMQGYCEIRGTMIYHRYVCKCMACNAKDL